MTPSRFELLCALERCTSGLSISQAAKQSRLPFNEAQRALKDMEADALIARSGDLWFISPKGIEALSPYRVKRAVILAAGLGSRLRPLTYHLPKPMISVRGVRIIDTLLDALTAAQIPEIHLIRGHFGEAFDLLLKKYPNLILTDNPLYASSNNLSSALCAKQWLQNAYICDADLFLLNPHLVRKYELRSNYLGCWCEQTDDWCFHMRGEFIEGASIGGSQCYRMYGLSYWNESDGHRLAEDIAQIAASPSGRQHFWDEVPLRLCQKHYRIALRTCDPQDILEIDTLKELIALDPSYETRLSGELFPVR